MKIRLQKKERVIFLIYYRGRGRAVGDGACVWVCDERISMGVIGMGDERRYLDVCLDGFGRRKWIVVTSSGPRDEICLFFR